MKLPERNDRYLLPTTSLVGAILLIAHLTGYITGWGWPILYICLLFMGHSTEYRDMFLPWRK
jgi:hypothetical protein